MRNDTLKKSNVRYDLSKQNTLGTKVLRGLRIREVLYEQQVWRAGRKNMPSCERGSDYGGFGLERFRCIIRFMQVARHTVL